jgi:4-amino-4-deoxy-L-arabinose transferase-like glycosyltransferase
VPSKSNVLLQQVDAPPAESNHSAPAGSPPRQRRWSARSDLKLLVLLTLLAAALRLVMLNVPTLEYDEAATYSRVTGTFHQMLDILRADGFTPLFYELYWVMAKALPLNPWVMRLPEAIAGIAMVPAIFFLARELTPDRRVALLSAGLAACSSYLLIFSRFAKMYMPLWMLATLFITCVLWWMRSTGRTARVAWLAWVAAAVAMNGLQALGTVVVAIALLIVITHPQVTWNKFLFAICGLAISLCGIGVHYACFNQWAPRVQGAQTGWQESGLTWIQRRNANLAKPYLMFDTATTFLFSYRGPRPPIGPPRRVVIPVIILSALIGALLIAAMLPHRRRDDPAEDVSTAADVPRHRGGLWIAAWVLLPAYGFYCVSFADALSPAGLMLAWLAMLGGWWLLLVPAAVAIGILAARDARAALAGRILFPLFVLAPLLFSVPEQWLDPLQFPIEHWIASTLTPRLAAGAALAALTALVASWRAISTRPARQRFLTHAALLIALCCAIWLAARGAGHDVWNTRYLGIMLPAVLIGIAMLIERLPVALLRQIAVGLLIVPNLVQFALHLTAQSNPPLDWIAMDVARARSSSGRVRTILALSSLDPDDTGLEGRGGLFDFPGKYYLSRALGLTLSPQVLRAPDSWQQFDLELGGKLNAMKTLGDDPGVREVVVWRDGDEPDAADAMRAALGPEWSHRPSETFEIRDYWCWRRTFRCARETFARRRTPEQIRSRARKAARAAQ